MSQTPERGVVVTLVNSVRVEPANQQRLVVLFTLRRSHRRHEAVMVTESKSPATYPALPADAVAAPAGGGGQPAQTYGAVENGVAVRRDLGLAVRRGFLERCPNCGKRLLFRAYLKVVDTCPVCGEDLHHQRADDAPPYITMLVVGHLIVAGVLAGEDARPNAPMRISALARIWLTVVVFLLLLPRAKGALVRLQLALPLPLFVALHRLDGS